MTPILFSYFASYFSLCQSIRIGADAAEELQLDAPTDETQQARAARQFSLNVQFPSGFNSNTNPSQFAQQNPSQFGQQSQSQFGQQTPFQNFPSFTQPTQSTLQQSVQQTRCESFFRPCFIFCRCRWEHCGHNFFAVRQPDANADYKMLP